MNDILAIQREHGHNFTLLTANDQLIKTLQAAVLQSPRNVSILRNAIRKLLSGNPPAYVLRVDSIAGAVYRRDPDEFAKFVTDPLPGGLQTDVATIRRLLRDYPEELALFDRAIAQSMGIEGTPSEVIEADTHDVLTTWQRLPLDTRKVLLPELLKGMVPDDLLAQVLAAIA